MRLSLDLQPREDRASFNGPQHANPCYPAPRSPPGWATAGSALRGPRRRLRARSDLVPFLFQRGFHRTREADLDLGWGSRINSGDPGA
ncbi:hypothetical protein NN561_015868 [Cricetulus griseus]